METSTTQYMSAQQAILVVDKYNLLGEKLLSQIHKEITPVLVSDNISDASSTIIHIKSNINPQIPDAHYSHMIFVWDKGIAEWVQPFLEKAAASDIKVLVIILHQVVHEVDYLDKIKEYATILIIGDLIGKEVAHAPLEIWLKSAKATKKIVLHNMGLTTWHPVLYKDVIEVTVRTIFSNVKKGEIFFACSEHIYTSLSLTHALQKMDPDIQVDLESQGQHNFPFLPQGQYLLDKSYPTLEKVKERYEHIVVEKKNDVIFPAFQKKQYTGHIRKKRIVPFFVYGLFVFFLMPLVIFAASGGAGAYLLKIGIEDMEKGKSTQAIQKITVSKELFSISQNASQVVTVESSIVGQQGSVATIIRQLSTAQIVSEGLIDSIQAYQKLLGVFMGKTLTPKEDVLSASNSMSAAIQTFQSIQDTSIPFSYKSQFSALKEGLEKISAFTDVLPGVIGAGEDRTYAILFQNNMELRPGGGFIGSYALLKLHDGKVNDFTIHDVYDSDGQLKGHVEPPFAIRRYIPIVHLFLRDSNFDVDNTQNAQEEAFLLNQETGEKVDGIIAVDLSFVKTFLSLIGSVYVPSYNQAVTADNFFLLTEQHAQNNFFPGSSQKKDFLNSLFGSIMEKVKQNTIPFSKNTLDLLLSSLNEKHILISFANPTIQEPFTYSGYSSALWDNRIDSPQQITDFLGINEANLGINKANYFVTRNVSQKVLVDDTGTINEAVTVTYTNNSKKDEWPGGEYKNYIRFILPLNANLQEVTINNVAQKIVPAITDPKVYEASHFVAPKGLEVEKTEEEGKTVYGFLITVPIQTTLTIGIAYQLADKVSLSAASATYSLKLFKQPGIDSTPYLLDIAYPKSFAITSGTKGYRVTNNVIEWTSNLTTDQEVDIPFSKQ